ncbi:MAG TPA: chromosome segregation protein SMC [Actinomycetaceae bacterium]|nr:chromosome segregation protein SMC [Actinomycetaceae bacterium]
MYLKTLTLRGFKSFASATTLHFEPGITCVVGPNGSGKSNVVDALAWVMGEQGAKTLRGGSMVDVIFAGTSSRPALGRAEVSLTIDNSDGLLPIDYTEVSISRTLFRGGGSEYAINGEPCRLLDIQELLSDTGMGREMHVIVGQGQLDTVLSAGPEERRGFIEEAAGILKHRRRKDKALRKLEAMRGNVDRLTDLTTEIRRQLGPLAKQADVARRAQVIQADRHDARARLLADDVAQLMAALAQDTADDTALRKRRDDVQRAHDAAQQKLAAVEQRAADVARQARAASDTWHALQSLRERLKGLRSLAAERARLLPSDTPARPGSDPRHLDDEARRVEEAHRELGEETAEAANALEAAVAARAAAEDAEEQAQRRLVSLQQAIADRREGLARLTGEVAARRTALEANGAELDRMRAAVVEAEERAEAAEGQFRALEQQITGAEAGEEGLDAAHEAALAEHAAAEEALAQLRASEQEAESQRRTWQARCEALSMSMASRDGTTTLLEAEELEVIIGSLPDYLRIAPGYEKAVAAALGAHADAAIVADAGDAITVLRHAREHELGHVALILATPTDPGPSGDPPAGGSWATDVVDATGHLAGPLLGLLHGTVVVEDLDAAQRVAANNLTAVTRDGDVLSPRVALGGGQGNPSVLELQAAHTDAQRELDAATAAAERARFSLAGATARLERAEEEVARTLADLHASDARLAGVAEQLSNFGAQARSARAEADRMRKAMSQTAAQGDELQRAVVELQDRLAAAQQQPQEPHEDVDEATAERDERAAAARQARHAETDARLALRTLEERLGALSGRAQALRRAADSEREARRRAEERAARRAAAAAAAAHVQREAEATLRAMESSLDRAAAERDTAERDAAATSEELASLRAAIVDTNAELGRLTDAVHREEVARAEQRARMSQLEERAVTELGMDPAALVAEFGPDQQVPAVSAEGEDTTIPYVRAEQEKRLRRAERELARLGKVNPLALEEHAALEERHQFLVDQLADLQKSRADLLEIVAEIDERVQRVFAEAFHDTAAAFHDVFGRLFPGGEGRLSLTDPDDMLTTGIEIESRPAGKKVKRLSLLSGGERSLTAVALLVAIFKARPSPFYVLDEVEAALDDTNLGRLLEVLEELRADSQLIVITHQKRTMEIADALYGVTMAGDGVTTVISQRLGADVSG